jgi:TRAP-type C4-dicarboxylate transport system permease large subunit
VHGLAQRLDGRGVQRAFRHGILDVATLRRVLVHCGLLTGGVLLILGTTLGFTNYLITPQVPDTLATWIGAHVESPLVLLLLLNLFLLVVGCHMDIFSAVVVIVPLILPVALEFGIDPLHLAIEILTNLELGCLTPPVDMNLFLAAAQFDRPIMKVARAAVPSVLVLLVGSC